MHANRVFAGVVRLILVAVFLAPATFGQDVEGRWRALEQGPTNERGRHEDVMFISRDVGWVVNLASEVHQTLDGGDTWERIFEGGDFGPRLRTVAFVNDRIGFVGSLSPGEVLFQTFDGGRSWLNLTNRFKSTPGAICGLWIVGDQHIFGVGAWFGGPWFIKSDDGGVNWSSQNVGRGVRTLVDVYFKNENEGFIIGGTRDASEGLNGEAVVLRTVDGGSNWTLVHQTTKDPSVTGEWGWKISFPSEMVGYVSVEYNNGGGVPAKVLKTVDGGLTWTELLIDGSTEPAGLQGIGFITEDIGWASGRNQTSVTYDGGATWQQISDYNPQTNPEGELDGRTNRFFVFDETTAYAVGRNTYKFEGNIPVTRISTDGPEQPKQFALDQNYPNPFSGNTSIGYELFENVRVKITVVNVLGSEVRTLVDSFQSRGTYMIDWDGRDQLGAELASGAYVYLLDIGNSIEVKRAVLLR